MVQTGLVDFEPAQWSGNQRMMHFGPMATRDPFFYYYPKGWDILYPAHFGFFPYRATKFRGSSPAICVAAFGVFFIFGGALMLFLVYFNVGVIWPFPFTADTVPFPILFTGPILFIVGVLFLLFSIVCSLSSFKEPKSAYDEPPYHPLPPPAYPVLENKYAKSSVYNPQSELKLYPPMCVTRHYTPVDSAAAGGYIKENKRSESVGVSRRRSSELSRTQRRAKSAPRLKGDRIRGTT
uniref:Uncharacterized protein n=1 Tax=Syphacia muris TaxID=451379 RepID=A0A0N5AYG2_9BILA